MNMTRLMCVCAALVALVSTSAIAGVATGTAAKIPFEFVAGGKNMPPGQYLISAPDTAGIVRITGDARDASVLVFGRRVDLRASELRPRLVFERSDGKLHLKEVWGAPAQSRLEVVSK